jgi:undecaprenyl diphosphate synthase
MTGARPDIPQHVAMIMDGNRRWAGLTACRNTSRSMRFRPRTGSAQEEVGFLMALLERFVTVQVKRLAGGGFPGAVLGFGAGVEPKLVAGMRQAEELTAANTRATVNVCFNYGGRRDIVEAVRRVVHDGLREAAVDEAAIEARLSSAGTPPPDLVIRTSGEQRLSNFLLWEAAYAELVFCDVLARLWRGGRLMRPCVSMRGGAGGMEIKLKIGGCGQSGTIGSNVKQYSCNCSDCGLILVARDLARVGALCGGAARRGGGGRVWRRVSAESVGEEG